MNAKNLTLLIFFLIFANAKRLTKEQKKALEDHLKCRQAENTTLHPLDCCKYPRFYDNKPQLLSDCNTECRMLPYPSFNCIRNCVIERFQVISKSSGGIVSNDNNIADAFFEQDEIEGSKPLPPVWKQIVINNTQHCLTEFPLYPGSNSSRNVSAENYWNYYYTNYIECIRLKNFLACEVNKTQECEKMKETISYCKTGDYFFLHKFFFEDFYYRNKTEEERLRKRKESGVTEEEEVVTANQDSGGSTIKSIETTSLETGVNQNVGDEASTKEDSSSFLSSTEASRSS